MKSVVTWKLRSDQKWNVSISRLIHELEAKGYVLKRPNGSNSDAVLSWEIFAPGLDHWVMQRLEGLMGSPVYAEWIEPMQKYFWDRLKFSLDRSKQTLQIHRSYWTNSQILLHGLISLFFVTLGGFFEERLSQAAMMGFFCTAHWIPFLLWRMDASRMDSVIHSLMVDRGFKLSTCHGIREDQPLN